MTEYSPAELAVILFDSMRDISAAFRRALRANPEDFVKQSFELIKTHGGGVYNKVKALFYDGNYRREVLGGLDKRGVKCVTYFSKQYPPSLKRIPDPPAALYVKGDTSLLSRRLFAVVGSRRTSPQAIALCRRISESLCSQFAVVTGIADGADTAAAEGALKGGGAVCVLPYGCDYAYPAMNKRLIDEIAGKGLAVSEYPPQTDVRAYRFPERNRIIAGLCEGGLIVSAGEKSGALITAEKLAEYGKKVFAFPYTPGIQTGAGCNALIKRGAKLCDSEKDIFGEFGLSFGGRKSDLSEEEAKLLKTIRAMGEVFVPTLADKTGTPVYMLLPLLSSLEIKGFVARLGGNRFSAV